VSIIAQPVGWVRANAPLVAVLVTTAITMMGQGVMSPVLPLFARELGVSVTLVGLVVGVFGLGRVAINIPAGMLSDRLGRRTTLALGPAILSLSALLMAVSTSYWQLLVLRFIQGMGGGMYSTTAMVYIAETAGPGQRGRFISYQQGALLFGTGVGPAVGGFLAEAMGLRAPFVLLSFLSGAASLWAVFQVREPPSVPRRMEARNAGIADGRSRSESVWRPLLTNPTFLAAGLFGAALFTVRGGSRQGILPLYLGSLGYGPADIGMLFTIGVLTQFFVVVSFGGLSDRFGRKAVIVPGAVIMALGIMVYIATRSYLVFALGMVLQQIGEGVAMPGPGAMVADLSRKLARPGAALGIFRTISDSGLVVGPVVVGVIVDWLDYRWGLAFSALVIVGAALIVATVAREPHWQAGEAPM
jgi:MFS family permease